MQKLFNRSILYVFYLVNFLLFSLNTIIFSVSNSAVNAIYGLDVFIHSLMEGKKFDVRESIMNFIS